MICSLMHILFVGSALDWTALACIVARVQHGACRPLVWPCVYCRQAVLILSPCCCFGSYAMGTDEERIASYGLSEAMPESCL